MELPGYLMLDLLAWPTFCFDTYWCRKISSLECGDWYSESNSSTITLASPQQTSFEIATQQFTSFGKRDRFQANSSMEDEL